MKQLVHHFYRSLFVGKPFRISSEQEGLIAEGIVYATLVTRDGGLELIFNQSDDIEANKGFPFKGKSNHIKLKYCMYIEELELA